MWNSKKNETVCILSDVCECIIILSSDQRLFDNEASKAMSDKNDRDIVILLQVSHQHALF